MKSLLIQIQPERAPGINLAGLTDSFRQLVMRIDLVQRHSFDNGHDDGAYYNFTFGTTKARELWLAIRESIFNDPRFSSHMADAAIAVCSGNDGWADYVLLCHWDTAVPVASLDDL